MKTKIKRLLRPALDWLETGQNLPAVTSHHQPEAVPSGAVGIQYPDVTLPGIDRDSVTRIVLTELIGVPLQYFKTISSYGRIDLVAYQPHAHYDPILPVPLVNMGQAFKTEYRAMALELSTWVSDMFRLIPQWDAWTNYSGYIHRRPPRPRPVSAALYYGEMTYHMERAIGIAQNSGALTPDEFIYFNYQLRLSIAQPDRFTEYDSEHWQKQWRDALAINTKISQG
jgi:hypothetical protein